MSIDRNVRCLTALNGASSSRVLNLTAIGQANGNNKAHNTKPLLLSRVLNNSIILKHRLRADEADLFTTPRVQATKIIIPFEKTNLKSGGQSMFIDQRGFVQMLKEIGSYKEDADLRRDLNVLRLIDRIPSLDPFLLREQLRTNGIVADPSYFEISSADQERMFEYTSMEISRLTALANGKSPGQRNNATTRMVSALLSSEVNDKLEPLRATLRLGPDEFSEGVFSWRGFIYYKWSLKQFWPKLMSCLREVKTITPVGKTDPALTAFFSEGRNIILQGAKDNSDKVRTILSVYDNAYASLIEQRDPGKFREFLLSAPSCFSRSGKRWAQLPI